MTCDDLVHPELSYEPFIHFAAGNSKGWCRFSCTSYIYTENQIEEGIAALQKSQKFWLEGLSGDHIIQLLWDHHQYEIRSAMVLLSWVLKLSRKRDPTIWSALQLDSWKKTCQKSLGMLSLWHLTWTKFTTETLILAKSSPSCHFLMTSQFKSKISLNNQCWWYRKKSV